MNSYASLRRASLLCALAFALVVPTHAQQTAAAQKGVPPPARVAQAAAPATIDTLLAADSYAVYGELRGIGAYVNSKEVTELLAPLGLPGGAPPEALDLLSFLRAHADELATARIMFAGMPVRAKLPDGIAAIELSSPEQAQKFEAELRKFITTHATEFFGEQGEPTTNTTATVTTTTTTATLGGAPAVNVRRVPPPVRAGERAAAPAPKPAPFQLVRAGSLLVLSDKSFTLAALHPADAPLLADEPGFQAARARFPHETLFVYFNTKRGERNSQQQRAAAEREATRQREEMERARKAAKGRAADGSGAGSGVGHGVDASDAPPEPTLTNAPPVGDPQIAGQPVNPEETGDNNEPPAPADEKRLTPEEEAQAEQQRATEQLLSTLPSLLFGGAPGLGGNNWPESIAAAAELADDSLVLRVMLVREGDDRPARPIPFVPLLMSGPALTPEAASVAPADTDVLISASLDLPQMYDYVASMLKLLDAAANGMSVRTKGANSSFDAQLGAFEKTGGFRIKEDLLAALGNEMAIAVPGHWLGVRRRDTSASAAGTSRAHGPAFFIALNDKKALQALLPRALEAAGLKGVSTQQLIEKRGDVEMLGFSQGTIAFIDRFLVIAPDADTMRHIVDSYNERHTLATSEEYHNSARWQPRQVLAQIYLSNALIKSEFEDPKEALEEIEDASIRDVLLRTNPEPGAITHALAKDDQGLIHELHIPKDALALMAADALVSKQLAPLRGHEAQARYTLQGLAQVEQSYKEKHGKYASLEELKRLAETEEKKNEADNDDEDGDEDGEGFTPQTEGYEFKLNISGDKFEATATPTIYRKTGRRSFYIDQTGVLRAADTGGKPADVNAPPVD
jgi:Protein of unknown function (DUF3352)